MEILYGVEVWIMVDDSEYLPSLKAAFLTAAL
jgi:hypothetical protein